MACNAAAKNLFVQSHAVKKLKQEIARLHQELQDKEQVHVIVVTQAGVHCLICTHEPEVSVYISGNA